MILVYAGIGNTPLLEYGIVHAGKYGTGSIYLNNCVYDLESFLYLKLYSTMILVNAGMGNKYSTFRVRYCPCWHLLVNMGLMI